MRGRDLKWGCSAVSWGSQRSFEISSNVRSSVTMIIWYCMIVMTIFFSFLWYLWGVDEFSQVWVRGRLLEPQIWTSDSQPVSKWSRIQQKFWVLEDEKCLGGNLGGNQIRSVSIGRTLRSRFTLYILKKCFCIWMKWNEWNIFRTMILSSGPDKCCKI